MDLAEVYDAYRSDRAFDHLRTDGIVLVPGEGSSKPKVLIVGEAPGATENLSKRPFVGASGRVIRSLIADVAELRPEDYFITNVVKYRPPGNRTPDRKEVEASLPYLRWEYAALGAPPIVVAVGGVALMALRPEGEGRGILAVAGEALPFGDPEGGRMLWPMVHPAYGLRNRSYVPNMEKHWTDFGEWFREEFE
jgi:DNA polymerase